MFDIQMGDKSGKVRVNTILREWKKSGVLAVEKARSDRQGREVPIIVVGERVTLDDLSL